MNAVLLCDALLAKRLGAYAPTTLVPTGIGVLTGEGCLIWPFVADDVKDLNRRTNA